PCSSLCLSLIRFALCIIVFCFHPYRPPRGLHSFPTRRSSDLVSGWALPDPLEPSTSKWGESSMSKKTCSPSALTPKAMFVLGRRSEEHTSELQSRFDLVCRLLLEKKKKKLYHRRLELCRDQGR